MADFMEFFDKEFLPKLGIRAPTFRAVMREAVSRDVQVIVETGTARQKDNWAGDGQSTIIWNMYAKWNKSRVVTSIDIDEKALQTAQENSCAKEYMNYILGDSVKVLTHQDQMIDLLYLDSFDVDMNNAGPAAMHCLFEFCSAKPLLKSGSIVFIDDSPIAGAEFKVGGKGAFVADYFRQLGVHPFTVGYQIAWIMP